MSQPVKRSICAHQTGTQGSSGGHRENKWWALIARNAGIERPNWEPKFGHSIPVSWLIVILILNIKNELKTNQKRIKSEVPCKEKVKIMILLWYFNDTSRLENREVSFYYLAIYQVFISIFKQIMRLWDFFREKTFSRERKYLSFRWGRTGL